MTQLLAYCVKNLSVKYFLTIGVPLNFEQLGLGPDLIKAVTDLGYTEPTEIQTKAIPLLLQERIDFVGQAQTGTGKTAAFVLPLLEKLDACSQNVGALILTPTRELANQISVEIEKLGKYTQIKSLVVFGGTTYDKQIKGLKRDKPQIVVGTPGRVKDLIKKGLLKLGQAEYFILDEADEMLNMGFFDDVKEILTCFNEEKKLWMFSATMPAPIIKLINEDFKNPEKVCIKKKTLSNEDIDQKYYVVKRKYHLDALCRILDTTPDVYGIIFCRTRMDTIKLAEELLSRGRKVESLHGDMGQVQRDAAMYSFKNKKAPLLVCTDVAARGIDVNSLTHVFNYGLPQDNESYVHRIGRTGRAGMKGQAVTIVDPSGVRALRRIEMHTKSKMSEVKLPTIDKIKECLVAKEISGMAPILEAVSLKGEKFKIDKTYEIFEQQFADLSKEDVAKIFFAWTFNRKLQRYDDLGNLHTSKSNDFSGRDRNSSRFGRNESRGDGRRGEGRRERDSGSRDGGSRRRVTSKSDMRLFLNFGRDDGLQLRNFISNVSKEIGINERDVRNVDMKNRFSFIDVPKSTGEMLLTKKLKLNNRSVRFEVSQ